MDFAPTGFGYFNRHSNADGKRQKRDKSCAAAFPGQTRFTALILNVTMRACVFSILIQSLISFTAAVPPEMIVQSSHI